MSRCRRNSEIVFIPCKGMISWPGCAKSVHTQPLEPQSALDVVCCQHCQSAAQGMTCNHTPLLKHTLGPKNEDTWASTGPHSCLKGSRGAVSGLLHVNGWQGCTVTNPEAAMLACYRDLHAVGELPLGCHYLGNNVQDPVTHALAAPGQPKTFVHHGPLAQQR